MAYSENTNALQVPVQLEGQKKPLTPRPRSTSPYPHDADASMRESPSTGGASGDENGGVLSGVMYVNKVLQGTIDALRLRLKMESKQYLSETIHIKTQSRKAIEQKDNEIVHLKTKLSYKDSAIEKLNDEVKKKDHLLKEDGQEIQKLRSIVEGAEAYVVELNKQITELKEQNSNYERDEGFMKQRQEVDELNKELKELRHKTAIYERELKMAGEIISSQEGQLGQAKTERQLETAQFKKELEKASQAMRQEVERLREVMRHQWEEMRSLKEQNSHIMGDLKFIRERFEKEDLIQRKAPSVDEARYMRQSHPAPNNTSTRRRSLQTSQVGFQNRPSLPQIHDRGFTGSKVQPKGPSRQLKGHQPPRTQQQNKLRK